MKTPRNTPNPYRTYEDPVTSEEPGPMGGTITTHPSYGQITAHRVSGQRVLYGSDVQAPAFVTVSITRSEMRRSLSRDWPFAREELIEVAMTEAQWAAFVSGLKVGSGPCCTIERVRNGPLERVAMLPEPKDTKTATFSAEMKKTVEEIVRRLVTLSNGLTEGAPLAKTKVDNLKKDLLNIVLHLNSNITFVAEQFAEHMEDKTEAAKMEINAYVTQTLMRAGLESLQKPAISLADDGESPTPSLLSKENE